MAKAKRSVEATELKDQDVSSLPENPKKPIKIILVEIEKLIPYPRNARTHPESQIKLLVENIKRFGFTTPLLVNKKFEVLAGHGRMEAAKRLQMKKLPCGVIDYLTKAEEKALRIADNMVTAMAGWDLSLVIEELKLLPDELQELTGFDHDLLIEGNEKDDEVPAEPDKPRSKTGDIYQVGNHRILCGDSTKKEDVEKLMAGKLSDMIHTDPPYNVDYGVSKNPRHKIRTIENDKQMPKEWEIFCKAIYANFKQYNKGDIYMWGAAGPDGMKMRLWLTEFGCHWSTTIIWKKDRLVLTPANYQRMYEPCFYGWFGKSSWDGGRKEVEVWEMKRPSDSKLHPTMKPIEVCERAIMNSSKERDIVMDLFLGSGSTLIACEKIRRSCYGIEIEAKYVDVCVQRWVNYTKQTDVVKNGKKEKWEITENKKVDNKAKAEEA